VADLGIRPYRSDDEAAVLGLLSASLGGGPEGERTAEFFRWKHLRNPFGESYMLVGEAGGELAGLRAFMRWRFRAGERTLHAVRAVDTTTHPGHRGRGVFSALTTAALEALGDEVDFVFNTPNRASGAGYLKMGWRVVGRPHVGIRVRRPARFLAGMRSKGRTSAPPGPPPPVAAEPAAEALADGHGVAALLAAAADREPRLHTDRDAAFLRWRYGEVPGLDYRTVRLPGRDGLAIFRVRPRGGLWECAVADVVVPRGDRRAAAALLRRAAWAARVDHVTCLFPPRSTARRAAARSGFVRARGPLLTARPVGRGLVPDPTDLASWAVTLGDLEVF
jgi:Acetyltransferase (GNAT) domain